MESGQLKKYYGFSDCLFWVCFGLLPIFTACMAIADESIGWAVIYVLVVLAVILAVVVRLFCTHCPHYRRQGKRVNCIFMWGFPKIFPARKGPLSGKDKLILAAGMLLLAFFPLPWLLSKPGLLLIYLLSASLLVFAMKRYECKRCIYFDCPFNSVSEQAKNQNGQENGSI